MPLLKGAKAKSKKGVSANISSSMHEGKPQKQSIAIAMRLAGKPKPKKKSAKKPPPGASKGTATERFVKSRSRRK